MRNYAKSNGSKRESGGYGRQVGSPARRLWCMLLPGSEAANLAGCVGQGGRWSRLVSGRTAVVFFARPNLRKHETRVEEGGSGVPTRSTDRYCTAPFPRSRGWLIRSTSETGIGADSTDRLGGRGG